MNQMTVVEVTYLSARYRISGSGYSLEGRVEHPAGTTAVIEDALLPFLVANDADLIGDAVVGDPTEGALLVLGHKAGVDVDATRGKLPRVATLPFDSTYKLMATFHETADTSRTPRDPLLRQGGGPCGHGPGCHGSVGREDYPLGCQPRGAGSKRTRSHSGTR